MIERSALLADLRTQVAVLEGDLRKRAEDDEETRTRLQEDWQGARATRRIAASYKTWLGDRVAQAAVAWVLGTVFLRFCEDNGLIDIPFIAGPGGRLALAQERQADYIRQNPHDTDRDWILAGFKEMSRSPTAAGLFDQAHNPMRQIEISHDAAMALLDFWRRRGEDGGIVHDFTDARWDTGFLGDLYQDLSDHAKKTYALLQTPEFVEEFVLDQTLDPAMATFGLSGLRLIDPACGSGHFLLGAFHRILGSWREAEPGIDIWEHIRRTFLSVHGVDKHPAATGITRFRLLVEAMKASGVSSLDRLPDIPIIVATGDSLLHGRSAPGIQQDVPHGATVYATEDVSNYVDTADESGSRGFDLLGFGSYHAVVGNPPYITPKDKGEAALYKDAFDSCTGSFAMTVPFIERFFQLAKFGGPAADAAGYVGMLVANSFMKREFGKRLIEDFLPTIELTHVIDTSGAYIPGHGTPTVMLFGRRRPPPPASPVLSVIGLRAEPFAPEDPAQGAVWQSIVHRLAGSARPDEWTRTEELDRAALHTFPWNLAGRATAELLAAMGDGRRLGDRVVRIGYVASSGADDLFTAPAASWYRSGAEPAPLVEVFTGSEVRDWTAVPARQGFLPLVPGEGVVRWSPISDYPGHLRRLWPFRTLLRGRPNFSGATFAEAGRNWYEWHHITLTPDAHPSFITFPWVATHPTFAVMEERTAVPLNSAPVIRLPAAASDQDVAQLAAVLNSSMAAFWMKQNSQSKGGGPVAGGEPWNRFFEFTPGRLRDLPLPREREWGERWSVHAATLRDLAGELTRWLPSAVVDATDGPSRSSLDKAREHWTRVRGRMMALQEELDWEIYERYGVIEGEEEPLPPESVPGIEMGQRAFEIVLARRAAEGQATTGWFERHDARPITEPPGNWPSDYRRRVWQRIEMIEKSASLAILERPEHKRRWLTRGWDDLEREALRDWLLGRLETRDLWYGDDGRPAARTAEELSERLVRRPDMVEALALYAPEEQAGAVIGALLHDHEVPYLSVFYLKKSGLSKQRQWEETWRLQRVEDDQGTQEDIPVPPRYTSADFRRVGYWRQRGRYNMPNERFVSYPGTPLYGWAGWDHRERATVLAGLIERGEDAVPLLAGLLELSPWLRKWHGRVDPVGGRPPADAFADFTRQVLEEHGLTRDDVLGWRPPEPKRGRPRKRDT
ncbi:BREX-2 system adenine-specific DNA-methyltransferase PglX [Actinomadura rubrisoli]|uniref:site-specific DNA-methyltransferase (adenine-specific) n=1 Tax=Actinomadura rubrisoli TaxID=2530368 RepID=A0A4R5AS82_9ACTN|nr:BREX-2 system adenine-specific DNA-methyltransferase PglX [Actinomadura rubrisoli]TDD75135.1 BREX-2 system adenine-specific DNA-methyltransferase PglX [Actinomadura rubrisoli]